MGELTILVGTAATLGLIHTVLGPDHYVPFIALAKARGWSRRRALGVTFACGLGHVLSSVVIGAVGLLFGVAILKLEFLESARGEIAGWLLFGFGLAYTVWGIRRALRKGRSAPQAMTVEGGKSSVTPWVLFIIFVLGPCEPLIPLLLYPAARLSLAGLLAVAGTFSAFTVATMLALAYAALRGMSLVPQMRLERYAHALAGFAILACGAGIQLLGL